MGTVIRWGMGAAAIILFLSLLLSGSLLWYKYHDGCAGKKEYQLICKRGCKIFCVYGNETFQIRIRYVVVFVGFCSRIFCRIYLSGYSISCPLSFIHAF